MADIPRLNGVIKALESGRPAFTCFSPTEVNAAINISASKYDGVVFEMEHNGYDIRALPRRAAVHAQPQPAGAGRHACARGDADGAHSVNGMREGAMARQAGARHRRLWRGVAAYFERRRSLQRGVGLPLSAHEGSRPTITRPDCAATVRRRRVRYWGLTQQEYYERADVWPLDPEGRDFRHPADGRHRRASRALDDILTKVQGIGCILIGEGDLSQELGYPAPVRASRSAQVDEEGRRHLQEAQGRRRPSACRSRQRRAHPQGRLHLPDGGARCRASATSTRRASWRG